MKCCVGEATVFDESVKEARTGQVVMDLVAPRPIYGTCIG